MAVCQIHIHGHRAPEEDPGEGGYRLICYSNGNIFNIIIEGYLSSAVTALLIFCATAAASSSISLASLWFASSFTSRLWFECIFGTIS